MASGQSDNFWGPLFQLRALSHGYRLPLAWLSSLVTTLKHGSDVV